MPNTSFRAPDGVDSAEAGAADGATDGLVEDATAGLVDGATAGFVDGATDGLVEDATDGLVDGAMAGLVDGTTDGLTGDGTEGLTDDATGGVTADGTDWATGRLALVVGAIWAGARVAEPPLPAAGVVAAATGVPMVETVDAAVAESVAAPPPQAASDVHIRVETTLTVTAREKSVIWVSSVIREYRMRYQALRSQPVRCHEYYCREKNSTRQIIVISMNFGDLQQKIALLAMGIKKVILPNVIELKCDTSSNCVSCK